MLLRISLLSLFLQLLVLTDPGFAERDWQQGVRYQIEAKLDTTAQRLNGTMQIFYRNNSPDTLTKIYLQVPSNAFHDEENTAIREMRRFSREGIRFSESRHPELTIQTVQFLNIGRETEFPLQAYDFSDTILDLTLPYALLPGDSLTLGVSFYQDFKDRKKKRRIPTEHVLWFPRTAVYDENGWHDEPFHFMMESKDVYAEFADYDVTLSVPGNYIVVASGRLRSGELHWQNVTADTAMSDSVFTAWHDSVKQDLKTQAQGAEFKRLRFSAHRLQNFTWSASPDFVHFQHGSEKPIHIFYRGKKHRTWLREVTQRLDPVMAYLEESFGPYPFDQLHIIKASGELIADPVVLRIQDDSPFELAYEMSSIYFPGIVGSNGVQESWLSKGLQVYMGKFYSEKVYGEKGYDTKDAQEDMNFLERQYPLPSLDNLLRNLSHLYMESGQNEPIAQPVYGYKDPIGLLFNTYLKAELFYEMLHYVIGDSAFKAGTRDIVQRHRFTHITEKELQRGFERNYGGDLDWFFQQWLHGTPAVDYQKGDVTKRKKPDGSWVTEVELKRKGDGVMPVEVEVELADGKKAVKRWDGKEKTGTLTFETEEKPKQVNVDPQDRIMDRNRLNNAAPRLEFRPDWPLLKLIHMPNDAILVLWRPSLGYNDYDSIRLGARTRTSYRAFFHNLTLEFLYGVDSNELDAEVAYSNPLSRQNLLNRYTLIVRKNEGRFEADVHLDFKGSGGILADDSRSLQIGLNYSDLLNSVYTFREVDNDTGQIRFDEWQDANILLAYSEGKIKTRLGKISTESKLKFETALPGGDAQFSKLSARVEMASDFLGLKATARGNFAASFGPDDLPLQDQFRAEGAGPRERFQNDIVKTGNGLTAFSRRYVGGGGYLRGYVGQPLPAEHYTTVNLELITRESIFLSMKPFGFYDTGRIWPTGGGDSFTRSDAGVGLTFFGDGLDLFGGNLGLFENLSAKLLFPLWLSHPLPGEKNTQFRWYFTLGKSL